MKNYIPKKKNITLLKIYLNQVNNDRTKDKRNNASNGLSRY